MKKIYPFILFLILLTACQEESSTIVEESNTSTTIPEATVQLLERITLNDGSADNIIDNASCIELVLPLTVNVNNSPVTINSNNDFQVIEFLLEENEGDEDVVTVEFPIVIILENHRRIEVVSQEELQQYIDACNGENEEDEDIESIDIEYPVVIPIFNPDTSESNIRSAGTDKELYDLLNNLDENIVLGIEFPVTLLLSDGSQVIVEEVDAMHTAIVTSEANYDEDDDNDFNDDDTVTLSEQEFKSVITSCGYLIENLIVDSSNETSSFQDYHFEFYDYGNTVTGCIGNILYVGSWDVTTVHNNLRLNIEFEELDYINKNWIVHHYESGTTVSFDLRLGEDILDFNMDCIDQTPDIIALLSQDSWEVGYFTIGSQNNTFLFNGYSFEFFNNSNVLATDNNSQEEYVGTWQVGNFGLELSLNFDVSSPLDPLNNNNWNIYYFDQNTIEMHNNLGDILAFDKI